MIPVRFEITRREITICNDDFWKVLRQHPSKQTHKIVIWSKSHGTEYIKWHFVINNLCRINHLTMAYGISSSDIPVTHYSGATWASWRIKSTATRHFAQQIVQADIEENIKTLHWSLSRGIHRWPVDSSYKAPVMRKSFPCQNVIIPEVWVLLVIIISYFVLRDIILKLTIKKKTSRTPLSNDLFCISCLEHNAILHILFRGTYSKLLETSATYLFCFLNYVVWSNLLRIIIKCICSGAIFLKLTVNHCYLFFLAYCRNFVVISTRFVLEDVVLKLDGNVIGRFCSWIF